MKTNNLFWICLLALVLVGTQSYGQFNILNAKSPSDIGKKTQEQMEQDNTLEPLPYGYTDDRDILWAKTTWEFIDLKQRVNFLLLYPLDTMTLGSDRKSLFQVLTENVKNGNIKHIYGDSYFNREITLDELDATLEYEYITDAGIDQMNFGEEVSDEYKIKTTLDGGDVLGFRVRGYWYFDNKQGDLRYRLIGLAPVVIDAYSKSEGNEDAEPVELFWVFYPEVRNILYKHMVFNVDNSAHPYNFDEILSARRFSAIVYKVDNNQDDRTVKDYIGDNSLMQLMESERLKEEIREFEVNMWNY